MVNGQFTVKIQTNTNTSTEEFCKTNKTVLSAFFKELDLNYKGLEKVKAAVSKSDYALAVSELNEYYKLKSLNGVVKISSKSSSLSQSIEVSNNALKGIFTFQSVSGNIDFTAKDAWSNLGPKKDMEWGYMLNRFGYFNQLLHAYQQTKDTKYSHFFNFLIANWISKNPTPQEDSKTTSWRVLESGIRVGESWIDCFYGFQNASEFTETARILMLISMFEHGLYLKTNHWIHHNHGVTELNSLSNLALAFPEFKKSKEWISYIALKMEDEFNFQVLPDGAQRELTSSYHWSVLHAFKAYIELNLSYNSTVPASFLSKVEQLLNYSVYSTRPDGFSPLNNDCDLYNNFKNVNESMKSFVRKDWEYVISNGQKGLKPPFTSIMFPWAGHMIMRNSWGENQSTSQYAFFDVGPWGKNHQHNDKLHLSVFSNGREILCDNGRLYYNPDDRRLYVNLSRAHNVILLDGLGQNSYEKEAVRPLSNNVDYLTTPFVDFSIGNYSNNFGDDWNVTKGFQYHPAEKIIPGSHSRAVVYVKNKFWVVFDQIQSDKVREIQPLWHFKPDCNVVVDGQSVLTTDSAVGNLMIQPIGKMEWKINLIKGQEKPYIQGWHSAKYNSFEPAFCAEYSTKMRSNTETFAWLMLPFTGTNQPTVSAKVTSRTNSSMVVLVTYNNEKPVEIALNFGDIAELKLSDNSTFTGRCIVRGVGTGDVKIDETSN